MNNRLITTVKSCASSGNIGPGFDTMGIAIDIYDTYRIYPSNTNKYQINYLNDSEVNLPTNEENLIIKSISEVINYCDNKIGNKRKKKIEKPLRIDIEINIPIKKGLGSSSAAIVAGLLIANEVYNFKLSKEKLLNIGMRLEPHPDNLSPALFGGFVISYMNGNKISVKRIIFNKKYYILLMISKNIIGTKDARAVIPNNIPINDCIFNIRNTVLLINSLREGNLKDSKLFIGDKIHQKYREALYPDSIKMVNLLINKFNVPSAISGAGPSVIGILDDYLLKKIESGKIRLPIGKEFSYVIASICKKGSHIDK